MNLDRAKELTAACVNAYMPIILGGERKPLPDVPLADLLEANRVVSDAPREQREDEEGRTVTVLLTTVDDRLVAAMYALQHCGGPGRLLDALGYSVEEQR